MATDMQRRGRKRVQDSCSMCRTALKGQRGAMYKPELARCATVRLSLLFSLISW